MYTNSKIAIDHGIKIGDKFNRLTVIDRDFDRIHTNGQLCSYFLCKCDCGNSRILSVAGRHLITGHTKSCGCSQRDAILDTAKLNITHGKRNDRIYHIYNAIISRCTKDTNIGYQNYGAKGIDLCNEWTNINDFSGFRNFYNWSLTHETYIEGYSIDRVDVSKGYSPDNCIWSNCRQQANNKTDSHYIEFINSDILTIADIAYIIGVEPYWLNGRLRYHNYDIYSVIKFEDFDGLLFPYILDIRKNKVPINVIYFKDKYGRVYTENDWISYTSRKIYKNWNFDEYGFVTTPILESEILNYRF